jgi:Zn-dependent protease
MGLSWTIGKFFQIPVRLHWSMLLLPLLTFNLMEVGGLLNAVAWVGLVVLIFGSVLLHEIGHALTARRYGIQTKDIILTPIGGMARITSLPTNPRHEIAIAIAGPLVSLALAGIGFAALFAIALLPFDSELVFNVFTYMGSINLMLGVFNLVPALPMDGGRVLRGFLALKYDFLKATQIAAKVGRTLAILGGILGLFMFQSWSLALISLFVYISAGTEVRMAQFREFQKTMGGAGFGPSGDNPFGPGPPHQGAGPSSPPPPGGPSDWTRPSSRPPANVVVVKGGKAKILSRQDPDED